MPQPLQPSRPAASPWEKVAQRYRAIASYLPKYTQFLPPAIHDRVAAHPGAALALILLLCFWLISLLFPRESGLLMSGLIRLLIVVGYWWSFCWLVPKSRKNGFSWVHIGGSAFIALWLQPFPLGHVLLFYGLSSGVKRGAELISDRELKKVLSKAQAKYAKSHPEILPLIEIGGIPIPNYLENLSFFFVGSPGSGKTQAIKRVLSTLRDRPDFRVIVLDRNGELAESFYRQGRDLLFNPRDERSVAWSHAQENQEAETIAGGLVPDDPKDRFFSEAAKSLLADIYERCDSNAQIWEVISRYSIKEIQEFLKGGVSARYFGSENTGSSVLSTLVNEMRFYKKLPEFGAFSFSEWGRSEDPRWLFFTIFEDDSELFKPLYTMGFELMLRGLLSHPDPASRQMQTAIVIDELGALNQLRSLSRLLAEGRKFKGTAILGTQTEAQIDRNYGEHDRRIILQGTCTKLILNCRDSATAEMMANTIGRQERIDITQSVSGFKGTETQQLRDVHVVLPTELQSLPNLQGYLTIADGTSPAKVQIMPQSYPKLSDRFIPAATLPAIPFTPSGESDPAASGNGAGRQRERGR